MLDINRRLLPYARVAIALLLLAGVAAVPTYGWLPLTAMLIGCAGNELVQHVIGRVDKPELLLVLMVTGAQVVLSAGIALAHGPRLFLLSILTFPLMFAAALFPARTVFLVTALSLVLLIAVALGFDASTVWRLPPIPLCAAINLLTLPLIMEVACTLDAESRGTVIIDPLTGLLNRVALAPLVAELRLRVKTTHQTVALIVGDLDHFKLINDRFGHAAGDVALREVAYCLRKTLGPFRQIYRLGGEEFLIVLADADAGRALAIAETLREAIAGNPTAEPALTMSFGVADSSGDKGFEFEPVFKRADVALYEAKRAGRDRVRAFQQARSRSASVLCGSLPSDEAYRASSSSRAAPPEHASAVRVLARSPSDDETRLEGRSWLIADGVSRTHLLDLTQRLTRRAAAGYALGFASVLVAVPYYGWLILVPGFITGAIFNLISSNLRRFRRPEYALGLAALLAQAGGACGLLVAHGEILFDLPVLIALLVGVSLLLPARGVLIGVLFTAAAMAAVAFVKSEHQVLANPSLLALPVALAATVGLIGYGLGRSDTEHRELAIVDPLTGMLNRAALKSKLQAVIHEANLTAAPVAIAIVDLDHFKAINDRHGHAVGDLALAQVAERIRSQLRMSESAYRVGGEEFVVLLPGALTEQAAAVAERIRRAVSVTPIEGIPVTLSIGVAASTSGEPFDYEALFALADAALYGAKRAGRDRVHCHARTAAFPTALPPKVAA